VALHSIITQENESYQPTACTNWDSEISWCHGVKVRDRLRRETACHHRDHRPPAIVQLPFRLYGKTVDWKPLLLRIIVILLYYFTNVTQSRLRSDHQQPASEIGRLSTAIWRPVLKRRHVSRSTNNRPRKCPTWTFRTIVKRI